MTSESDYLTLGKRLNGLLQTHAVMVSNEEQKAKRIEEIKAKLKSFNIDPENQVAEIARLEAESTALYDKNKKEIDEFEAALKNPPPVLKTKQDPTGEELPANTGILSRNPLQPTLAASEIDLEDTSTERDHPGATSIMPVEDDEQEVIVATPVDDADDIEI